MAAEAPTAGPPARLNPFVFPSETDSRFALLVVTVLGSTLFIYDWISNVTPGAGVALLQAIDRCEPLRQEASAALSGSLASLLQPFAGIGDPSNATTAYTNCMTPYWRGLALWSLGGVLLVLVGAVLVYWFLPWWKIRSERLELLRAEDAPDLVEYVADLCREAGLRQMPILLMAPTRRTPSGVAFGRVGRRYVAMNGGLVTQFIRNRPAFRAVLLHELAHLRNADIDKTYLTIAICLSFVVTGLLPFVGTIAGEAPEFILSMSGRVLALAVLVTLTGAAVLRARESYADVRASVWDGPTGALRSILDSAPPASGPRWLTWWRLHPDPVERHRVVDDPRPLFRLRLPEAFATGLAATIAFESVEGQVAWLSGNQAIVGPLISALIFAPLLTSIVGLAVWRETFAARADNKTLPTLTRPALSLAGGLFVGQVLSLDAFFALPTYSGSLLFAKALWSVALFLCLYLFLSWIRSGASVWLEVVRKDRDSRLIHITGLLVASGILTLWLALLFTVDSHIIGGIPAVRGTDILAGATELLAAAGLSVGVFVLFTQLPLTSLALLSLWAFPLAAALRQREPTATDTWNWAYLEPPSNKARLPRPVCLEPRPALGISLVGALVYCILLLITRSVWRLTAPESTEADVNQRFVFFFLMVIMAVIMQMAVAALTAGWVRHLKVVHGLGAAFVSGCVMAVGALSLNLLFGGNLTFGFAWSVFAIFVNGGAVFALAAAIVTSALKRERSDLQATVSAAPA